MYFLVPEDSFLPFDRELIVQLVLGGGGKIMEEFSYQKVIWVMLNKIWILCIL